MGEAAVCRCLRPPDRQETFEVSTGTQMSCSARSDARNTPAAFPFTRIYILFTVFIFQPILRIGVNRSTNRYNLSIWACFPACLGVRTTQDRPGATRHS